MPTIVGWLLFAMLFGTVIFVLAYADIWPKRSNTGVAAKTMLTSPSQHREDSLKECLANKRPHFLIFGVRSPGNRVIENDYYAAYSKHYSDMPEDQVNASVKGQIDDCVQSRWVVLKRPGHYEVTDRGRETLRRLTA